MNPTIEDLYDRCEPYGNCMLWQQSCINGHPQMRANGKSGKLVRRYIFTDLLGKAIPPKHVLSTSCNEPLCIAAECIKAYSYSNRLRKAYREGRRATAGEYLRRLAQRVSQGQTALSFDKAREIRASNETNDALAAKYGVHRKTIQEARNGHTWRESMPNASVFSIRA